MQLRPTTPQPSALPNRAPVIALTCKVSQDKDLTE